MLCLHELATIAAKIKGGLRAFQGGALKILKIYGLSKATCSIFILILDQIIKSL